MSVHRGGSGPVGVPGPGGSGPGGCLVPEGCLVPGGAWWSPPGTATATGGTHPTVMHSCFTVFLVWGSF